MRGSMRGSRLMKLLSCLLLFVADGVHLPACGDGSAEETALISTFGACGNDPVYLRTGNTGCCGADNRSLGECDVCTGKFSCTGSADVASVGWGVIVALLADILISVGLVMQKVAHVRVAHMHQELDELDDGEDGGGGGGGGGVESGSMGYARLRVWWFGLAILITAEAGNFLAYGDTSTAAAVIASIGCVGVVSNWIIATIVLKEAFRWRDLSGVLLILSGVILVIFFVPYVSTDHDIGGTSNLVVCPFWYRSNYSAAPCGAIPAVWPSGDGLASEWLPGVQVCELRGLWAYSSDYWYAAQPAWVAYTLLSLGVWLALYVAMRSLSLKSVFVFLALADIAGGFTVASAVTVSTMLFGMVAGPCLLGTAGLCEPYVLAEPIFWVALVVLASTAATQVIFLNRAMQLYDAGLVVPVHYVFFTISSIIAPSMLYNELTLNDEELAYPASLMLTVFLFGILLTFLGVSVISGGQRSDGERGGDGRSGGSGAGKPGVVPWHSDTAQRLDSGGVGPVRVRRTRVRPKAGNRAGAGAVVHTQPSL
tara:strand:- start:790 stop:2406 length:1617 start_codon:yes stop_codon:yes gene_type:complete